VVRYERPGAAALVTIDRPERRNAIDGPTAEALHEAFRRFLADDDARVLVLTGAGEEAFCAGADLKAIDTLGPRLALPEGPLGFSRLASPKPSSAAVSGRCVAGGFEVEEAERIALVARAATAPEPAFDRRGRRLEPFAGE